MPSFFVSYNKADKAWAEWIAWILEEEGHTAVIQAWDFRPGGNFVLDMQRAAAETDKTLVVLSEDYLNAEFTQPEWAAAFADDPGSLRRKIIPIRVRECRPSGLLRPIVYVDLVNLEANAARQVILNALPERLKPDSEPPFPKIRQAEQHNEQPAFPNEPLLKPWNVPYERNPFFTGREEVLQTLYQQLNQDKAVALSQIQAIYGLGGIGKTQTAVEYTYRHRQDYQAVFWVRAETDLELRNGFVEIARLLNLPQQDAQDPNDTVQAVKHWLESNPDWLLIFDNADHPEQLKPFRPTQAQGHILLTSRAQTFDMLSIAQPMSLQKMSADEAVTFLFKRANRETNDLTEQDAAIKLAEELGFLPLALEQAGAFILRRQLRIKTYLNQYRKQRLALLERQQPTIGNEQQPARSIQTTWQLNFEAVSETNPASAELLQVSAFVAPDRIPYELLIAGRESLGNLLSNVLESEDLEDARFVITELLEPLRQYSLIKVEPELGSYTIHRLVQEVIKNEMDEGNRHLWAKRTINAVSQAFPDAKYESWSLCEQLLPSVRAIINLVSIYQIESENVALLLNRTGYYLRGHAQYDEAEPIYLKALEMRQRLFGDLHPDLANSLNHLGRLYKSQNRYSEAESFYLRALEISQKLFGDEHSDIANSLHHLGRLCVTRGRYVEAEPLLLQALEMRQRLFGDLHPDVANSLHNLAKLYKFQGHYVEAETSYLQALKIKRQLFGDNHPSVASSLHNLAKLYKFQGRYVEAEPLHLQSLEMKREFLGENHPSVALCLNDLAELYRVQNRYTEAEPLYIQALETKKRLRTENHPSVAHSLNDLAKLYSEQGRYAEAEPLLIQSLKMKIHVFGDVHPSIAQSLHNLADTYLAQQRLKEAESLLSQSLEMYKQLHGDKHPNTIAVIESLELLRNQDEIRSK